MDRVLSLDGLRGYAAIMVLLAHVPKLADNGFLLFIHDGIKYLNLGYLGVDVFFILSGYLITRNLISYKKGWVALKYFYINRALRIFPIYYLTLLLTILFINAKGWEWNFLYLANYYFSWMVESHPMRHAWSLAVEEHFYLVWPFLFFLVPENSRNRLFIFIAIVLFCCSIYYFAVLADRVYANNLLYRGTQFRFVSLFLGSMMAMNEITLIGFFQRRRYLSLLSFIMLYILLEVVINKSLFSHGNLLNYLYFPILSSLLFLIAKTSFKKLRTLLFENTLITFIGSISYGLYLYHYPILYIFGMTSQQNKNKVVEISLVMIVVIIIFFISIMSKFYIENPILKNKYAIPLK